MSPLSTKFCNGWVPQYKAAPLKPCRNAYLLASEKNARRPTAVGGLLECFKQRYPIPLEGHGWERKLCGGGSEGLLTLVAADQHDSNGRCEQLRVEFHEPGFDAALFVCEAQEDETFLLGPEGKRVGSGA